MKRKTTLNLSYSRRKNIKKFRFSICIFRSFLEKIIVPHPERSEPVSRKKRPDERPVVRPDEFPDEKKMFGHTKENENQENQKRTDQVPNSKNPKVPGNEAPYQT